MSNPLVDMDKPDAIFCIGTNMTECHPVAATRLKKAIANGARMIVADPRKTGLAKMSDLYLPIRVGSDVALLLAMAHVIHRDGLIDESFVKERTAGVEEFLSHVKGFTPEWASEICEIPLVPQGIPGARYWKNMDRLANFASMPGWWKNHASLTGDNMREDLVERLIYI